MTRLDGFRARKAPTDVDTHGDPHYPYVNRQLYYTWLRRFRADGLKGRGIGRAGRRSARRVIPTEAMGKIVYLRQQCHFGPEKIAMYLQRYRDVMVSKSEGAADPQAARPQPAARLPALQAVRSEGS